MLELTSIRKNKINLADYHFQQDIDSRIIMGNFSSLDLEILEELLFNPLKISIRKLCRAVNCTEEQVGPILSRFVKVGLVECQGDWLLVDKERRKYFELQVNRFGESFSPDLEFLQGLLKLIPIHILPNWYSIPRSSNSIFESIIEKYLLTPQTYQRYLADTSFFDPTLSGIMHDVFSSPQLRVNSGDLIEKYNLSRTDFEHAMLFLEFSLVCFVGYHKEGDHWQEWVSPIHEWREYMLFAQKTEAPVIEGNMAVNRFCDDDFGFIHDMEMVLRAAAQRSLVTELSLSNNSYSLASRSQIQPSDATGLYIRRIIQKLKQVQLLVVVEEHLIVSDEGHEWLNLSLDSRALYLHRHSLNWLTKSNGFSDLYTEKNLREIEKALKRVTHGRWVRFEDFAQGSIISFNESEAVVLKKRGRQWRYILPQHSPEETAFLKACVFEYMFECGIVAIGSIEEQDCFFVTAFGQHFLEG
jgi:hypothetical protein